MGGGLEARQPEKDYYFNQGGWNLFTWGGVDRVYFLFTDSLHVGGCLGTG